MARDVAVAIGVERSGDLVPLPGAVQGAKDFAGWANDPNGGAFDTVVLITDEADPVDGKRIFDAINAEVKAFDVQKLFVFFAGHGVSLGLDVDYWLLSPGPADTTDGAVNVANSLRLARRLGIPHVAVFADHCRTMADKPRQGVHGRDIFPNLQKVPERFELDAFYAALPGDPSQEITDKQAELSFGIFTKVLLRALGGADEGPVSLVPFNGETHRAVSAFRLRDWIVGAVEIASEETPGAAPQTPDARPGSQPPNVLALFPNLAEARLEIVAGAGDPPATSARLMTAVDSASEFSLATEGQLPLVADLVPGTICRIDAVGVPDTHRQDEVSGRAFEFAGPQTVSVSLQEGGAGRPAEPPTVWRSTIVDASGAEHEVAPTDGVFEVRFSDDLTGRVSVDYQVLAAGDTPKGYVARDPAAENAVAEYAGAVGRSHFETGVGLTVVGVELDPHESFLASHSSQDPLVAAVAPQGHQGVFREDGSWHVRAALGTSGSAVVDIGGERRAAVAVFAGFVGTVVVDERGVRHVAYVPPDGSPYDEGPNEADEQRRAMAIASVAAANGRFEVTVDESPKVAAVLRRYKHKNPTLGILAAYAYDRVGRYDQIEDMIAYFRDAEQTVPYDLVMLAGLDPDDVDGPVAPAYPMLTQGWAYLDVNALPDPIRRARDSLAPTLWATVTGKGGRALAKAVLRGDLR